MKCCTLLDPQLYSVNGGAYQNHSLEYPWLLNRLYPALGVDWGSWVRLGLNNKKIFQL